MASVYTAPLDDMRFVAFDVLNIGKLAKLAHFQDVDIDTINLMLEESAKFSENVLKPLNEIGDREGCKRDPQTKAVTAPAGFKEAYTQFCELGFTALTCEAEHDGLGMPYILGTMCGEMQCSANMAFSLYPGLSRGFYNALNSYGSDVLKTTYLPKIASGEWSGTMCLTEGNSGTDLRLNKTVAKANADGTYAVTGEKIFISAGEHDFTGNIAHLVLAKIDEENRPSGTKALSLFVVPKFLPNADGSVGERNNAFCEKLEEKSGIHGNATCVMNFDSATAFLVGEKNAGMKEMFVMMNEARLGVGLQGLGVSEAAYQEALAYAQERKQGLQIGEKNPDADATPIFNHPNIRHDLLTMKSQIEAGRMLAYYASTQVDLVLHHADEDKRKEAQAFLDYLTPVIKAHLTDNAEAHASLGMQILGGAGYTKEFIMEQLWRDARITRIYEGTNFVQSIDMIGRKTLDTKYGVYDVYIKQVRKDLATAQKNGVSSNICGPMKKALTRLHGATGRLRLKAFWAVKVKKDTVPFKQEIVAVAENYTKLASLVVMGHMWLKMATAAQQRLADGTDQPAFYEAKLKTAAFYMTYIMPDMHTLTMRMRAGIDVLMAIADEDFEHGAGTIATEAQPEPEAAPPEAGRKAASIVF